MFYRKKPVIIEARQLNNDTVDDILKWLGDNVAYWVWDSEESTMPNPEHYINIKTLEGIIKATPGDHIIKGVKGEFYPCKPDIFEMTYEPV